MLKLYREKLKKKKIEIMFHKWNYFKNLTYLYFL